MEASPAYIYRSWKSSSAYAPQLGARTTLPTCAEWLLCPYLPHFSADARITQEAHRIDCEAHGLIEVISGSHLEVLRTYFGSVLRDQIWQYHM